MRFVPPTADELATVQQMRTQLTETEDFVPSPRITDVTILRFLRGQKGNVESAIEKLITHSQWRKEMDVDNIDSYYGRFKEQFDKKLLILGNRDREDRPCSYGFSHKHDKYDRDADDMELCIIYLLEQLVRTSNPDHEMFAAVIDMSRFSMRCMDFEVCKIGVSILQGNYPDTLAKLMIVDAPFIFQGCWAIIRPWLDPVTASKVAFIKRAQLDEYLDAANIPSFDV